MVSKGSIVQKNFLNIPTAWISQLFVGSDFHAGFRSFVQ